MPRLLPHTAASNFRKMKYLHQELTYGLSENKLWINGEQIRYELGWEYAEVWDEREGWLRISANHIPNLWFKIGELREAVIYDRVIELCKKHAVKFSS